MYRRIKGKKGAGLTDIFVFLAVAFIIVMVSGIFVFIGDRTYTELLNKSGVMQDMINSSEHNATEIIEGTFGNVVIAYEALKWVTVMLIVGMLISILISSYMVRTNPVWFGIYILISIIAVIVAVPMSNTYEVIYSDPVFASSFSGFFGQTYIFLHLPIWVAVIVTIAGILMYINMARGQSPYGGCG